MCNIGAEIYQLCNEAAMIAAREKKESIEWIDFEQGINRVRLCKSLQIHSQELNRCLIIPFCSNSESPSGEF